MVTDTLPVPLTGQIPIAALPRPVAASARRRPGPARRQLPRPIIISEELFRAVLIKERKRVDRLNQPLILLTVAVNDRQSGQSPSIWVPVLEALAAVTRDTDILGWFEWRG